jgi:hypothetical protein
MRASAPRNLEVLRRLAPVLASIVSVIAGFVVLEARSHGLIAIVGVVLMGLGLFGVVIGLFAMTLTSGSDREREESARAVFERTGRWPGE